MLVLGSKDYSSRLSGKRGGIGDWLINDEEQVTMTFSGRLPLQICQDNLLLQSRHMRLLS